MVPLAVQSTPYQVVCGVEISNATTDLLTLEGYYVEWGKVKSPPCDIQPGVREAFVAHKTEGCATGTTGVAAWKIGDSKIRLVVMWSLPWDQNQYSNTLALGFKENEDSVPLNRELYEEMYSSSQSWFSRLKYESGKACQPISRTNLTSTFKVQGRMGTSHKCEAFVELLNPSE